MNNWYVYLVERSNPYCKVKELRAVQNIIKVNKIEIDSKSKFGARFQGDRTETFSFLAEIDGRFVITNEDLEEKLEPFVKKYGTACFYEFLGKDYLILPVSDEKMGVWHEDGCIFHQVRPNSISRKSEVVLLGNSSSNDDEEIMVGFNTEEYFKVWKQSLFGLLCRGVALSCAVLASFAQAYNYWLYMSHYPAHYIYKNEVNRLRNGQAYYNSNGALSVQAAYAYYPRYWVHTWKGMTIDLKEFYSSLSAAQLTYAYYLYIVEFWDYIQDEFKDFMNK